jgi:hypothetical protein
MLVVASDAAMTLDGNPDAVSICKLICEIELSRKPTVTGLGLLAVLLRDDGEDVLFDMDRVEHRLPLEPRRELVVSHPSDGRGALVSLIGDDNSA